MRYIKQNNNIYSSVEKFSEIKRAISKIKFYIFIKDHFDPRDGDWIWHDIPMSDDGFEFQDTKAPPVNEVWYISAFSMHPELGLSIVEKSIRVSRLRSCTSKS